MKKVLYLLAAIMLVACSKDNDTEILVSDTNVSDADIEIYQQAFNDAVSFLEADASIDINTAVEFVKTLEGVTDVTAERGIIKVRTQSGTKFYLDFNSYPEFERESIDMEKIQHVVDSINNTIDMNISSGYESTAEVFKDYLARISHYEDDANTSMVTRANNSIKRVKLSRHNVAIWNPWKDFSDETKCIDDVTYFINKEHPLEEFTSFTPASFKSFEKFDVVYVSTHGYENGDIILPFDCLTEEQLKLYNKESDKVALYWEKDKLNNKCYKGILLTEKFFEKYLPDLSNTIIYTSACYLGVKNSTFLNSCLKKNVADYFASDTICTSKHIIKNFEEFYIYLMCGYSSNRAFANGKGFFIGSYVYDNKPWTYKYSRYGSKLVYYPTPHATGVGNRTTNSHATRSNDGSSSTVVNAQIRYATEESDDILNTIEAGICLQDMDTKQVTLIPFSSRNIVSNEKKSYGDVTVSNISASLDNLTEGHQYAYCCYTKVDGVVTLSDETYSFSKTENYVLVLRYLYDYKHTLYAPSEVWVQTDKKDIEDFIEIAKFDGQYYYNGGTGKHPCDIYVSSYEPLKNGVVSFRPAFGGSEGTGTLSITIDADNIKMICYCDNYYHPGEYSSHFEGKIVLTNLDSSPNLIIEENDWYSHTNRFGLFKNVDEYKYNYLGYKRRPTSGNYIW